MSDPILEQTLAAGPGSFPRTGPARQGPPPRARRGWRVTGRDQNRAVAVLVWLCSVGTTYMLLVAVLPTLPLWPAVLAALLGQYMLTRLELPAIRRRRNALSLAVLLADIGINAGGLYPLCLRAAATPTAQAIMQAAGLQASMSPGAALALALFLGTLLALVPEAVWNWPG